MNYEPNPKQRDFHDAGDIHQERALFHGNQTGGTTALAAETAYHATGVYPEWWTGMRYASPVQILVASVTRSVLRDSVQRRLREHLPPGSILAVQRARIDPTFEKVWHIAHLSIGASIVRFKSYEQDTSKLFTDDAPFDLVVFDQEPSTRLFDAAARHVMSKSTNRLMMGMTPLKGMTPVVRHFYPKPDHEQRHLTMMTVDDAPHLPALVRSAYPQNERNARLYGRPLER